MSIKSIKPIKSRTGSVGERKYYETWRRQLCILDNFLCMSLTLQSALNLLVLNSALLKGEAMPINSTLSFLLLFSINSSVNYSLLLQQLFLTVVIIIFCCCLFSWTDCLMPFLSLLCFFVICIKTHNAISIVSSIHSALSLSKKLVKKKKENKKKPTTQTWCVILCSFLHFLWLCWSLIALRKLIHKRIFHKYCVLFAEKQFCCKRKQVFIWAWTCFNIMKTVISFSLKPSSELKFPSNNPEGSLWEALC